MSRYDFLKNYAVAGRHYDPSTEIHKELDQGRGNYSNISTIFKTNDPNLKPEHVNRVFDYNQGTPEDFHTPLKVDAINTGLVSPDVIHKAYFDQDHGFTVRNHIVRQPDSSDAIRNDAIRSTDRDMRYAAIRHPLATREHVLLGLKDTHQTNKAVATRSKHITESDLDDIMKGDDEDLRVYVMMHPLRTKDHINAGLHDPAEGVRRAAKYAVENSRK